MNSDSFLTSTKISSDITTSSMQISSEKVEKASESTEENQAQNKQELKRSIANLTTILSLVEFEMQKEQEYNILEALAKQKKSLEEIILQKETQSQNSHNQNQTQPKTYAKAAENKAQTSNQNTSQKSNQKISQK